MEFKYGYGERPLQDYKIMRGVGKGAFGEVYFAISNGGREVALKRLGENAEIELRGVNRCINIKNPHLVSIFDIKTGKDNRPYIIMEYVAGPSLRDVLNKNPKGISTEKAIHFFNGIASALSSLHSRSIVHRDLKPENIFLDDNYVKIGDYGLAKHISISHASRQTINLGTVHYMAPEIATGKYDHRVDIYAVGIILFEMLTGETPFTGRDIYEIALKHSSSQIDLSKVPKEFKMIVGKATAKNPAERYKTIGEMARNIQSISKDNKASTVYPSRKSFSQKISNDAGKSTGKEKRKHVTIFSDKNWLNRIIMMMIASLGMAFAVSLIPDIGFKRITSTSLIGAELLPLFLIITLGSIVSSSIGLWFYNQQPASTTSAISCRFLTTTIITFFTLLAFAFGPYFIFTQNYFDGDFGIAMNMNPKTFKEFLLLIFVCALLVNWFETANPERGKRINILRCAGAAFIGWLGCIITGLNTFLICGILGGISLGVNFLSPIAEDIGILRPGSPETGIKNRSRGRDRPRQRRSLRKENHSTPWPLIILFIAGVFCIVIVAGTNFYRICLPFPFRIGISLIFPAIVLVILILLITTLKSRRHSRSHRNHYEDDDHF